MLNRVGCFCCGVMATLLAGCSHDSSLLIQVDDYRANFSTPRPVTKPEMDGLFINYQLPADAHGPALVFATTSATRPDAWPAPAEGEPEVEHECVILQKADHGWLISRADLFGFWWRGVSYTQDRKHLWAVVQYDVEDPDWQLHLYHSGDGGRSWVHWAAIVKPYYVSDFAELQIGEDGRGWLSIVVSDDIDTVAPGIYFLRNQRLGKTLDEADTAGNT